MLIKKEMREQELAINSSAVTTTAMPSTTAAAVSSSNQIPREQALRQLPDYLQRLNVQQVASSHLVNQLPQQMNPKDKCSFLELSKQFLRISYQGIINRMLI